MPRPLKVFRTAVGFRDAYVAASSKAAALRAWGTDKDLFARGAAEEVSDPALMQDPLNRPGEVVYRTRGGLAEQVAALDKLPARKAKDRAPAQSAQTAPRRAETGPARERPARPPAPKPSRAELEATQATIAALKQDQAQAEAELRRRERELAADRKATESRFAVQLARLKQEEKQARDAYDAALRAWEP